MAKTKTPFFSLGAQGSVGRSITAQKRDSSTLVRQKPLPTDPYSLTQAYQRWLYQDYAYLWRQQSTATKAEYRAGGSRFHLTGFQYWMKYQLKNLPGIAALWHMDRPTGATAPDSSRNENHATIFGATPETGLIDGALGFDGVNNRLLVPFNQTLDFAAKDFSFIFYFYLNTITPSNQNLIATIKNNTGQFGYSLQVLGNRKFGLRASSDGIYDAPTDLALDTAAVLNALTWYSGALVWTHGVDVALYLDGAWVVSSNWPAANNLVYLTNDIYIGIREFNLENPLDGILDHMILYTRALDATELALHAARRY